MQWGEEISRNSEEELEINIAGGNGKGGEKLAFLNIGKVYLNAACHSGVVRPRMEACKASRMVCGKNPAKMLAAYSAKQKDLASV